MFTYDVDPKYLPAIEAFRAFVKEHPEQIVIMGWKHDDETFQNFLRSKQFIDALIENFRHMGWETPPNFQATIDQFTRLPNAEPKLTSAALNAINRSYDRRAETTLGARGADWLRSIRKLNQSGVTFDLVDKSPRSLFAGPYSQIADNAWSERRHVLEKSAYSKLLADIVFDKIGWRLRFMDEKEKVEAVIQAYNELKNSTEPAGKETFVRLEALKEADIQGYNQLAVRLYDPLTARKILSLVENESTQSRVFVPFGNAHLSECSLSLKSQLGNKAVFFHLFRNRAEFETYQLIAGHPEIFVGFNMPMKIEQALLLEEGVMIHPAAPGIPAKMADRCSAIRPPQPAPQ